MEQPEIEFTDEVSVDRIRVTVQSLAGSSFVAAVSGGVTVGALKGAIASKLDLDVREFRLAGDTSVPPEDGTFCGALVKPGGSGGEALSLYLIKHTPLDLHEARSLDEWREVARALGDQALEDDTVFEQLVALLDRCPALVNLQQGDGLEQSSPKPLLSYATEGVRSLSARQRCVDELLRRGARVCIHHESGSLVDRATASESAFRGLLEGESRSGERASYEREALSAWRSVSSRLCGETAQQVHDEAEMTRIVVEFCEKHPEMVNFQNNHAVDERDQPYGYFGYAPLITFAGAQACRRRRGTTDGSDIVRRDSVQQLLRHGGRADMHHGGRTAMEWMKSEGSLLVPWLEEQLKQPVPEQANFSFSRA